jgi:peroxin-12
MSRVLLRQPWCRPCCHETIRSFLSVSGVTLPRYTLSTCPLYSARRPFSLASRLRSEHPSSNTAEERQGLNETDLHARPQPIPWYLQEETPVPESQPASSRDHLPDLPENPPAILPPLLEYAYKDLGLDDLKLLDLRSLETPAALGANVIMVIGTARSVKHLNVSADRLCRWMRSSWKLTPYADGLLGRNELKIKLRRKTRRARAATQAGAILEEKDDGITTGWICVNAGVVQEDPNQPTLQEQGIEGFGSVSRGTRVVAQIFTDEKRADVNLDGLWEKRLEQSEREKQRLLDDSSEAPVEEVRDPAVENRPTSDHDFGHFPRPPTNFLFEQRRGLHHRPVKIPPNEDVEDKPSAFFNDQSSGPEAREGLSASGVTMTYLFDYLSSLPEEKFRSELGTGPEDSESTLFLRIFRQRQFEISPQYAALAQVQLLCTAVTRKHPSYPKQNLWTEFVDYARCGYVVFDDMGLRIISALLMERPVEAAVDGYTIAASDIELALRVCEQLSTQGMNLLNMKVFNMLYNAARHAPPSSVGSQDQGTGLRNEALVRIPRVVEAFEIPFDPEESRIFMWSLFEEKDFIGFWKLWHRLPLNNSPRTATDYEQLFRRHAELGDGRRAKECVATWLPMMKEENPPVPENGAIMQHVQACNALRDVIGDQMASLQRRLMDEELDPWF